MHIVVVVFFNHIKYNIYLLNITSKKMDCCFSVAFHFMQILYIYIQLFLYKIILYYTKLKMPNLGL